MQIIREKLEIEETLKKRINNVLMFLSIKGKIQDEFFKRIAFYCA